jgi:hypothetical protein
MAMSLIWDMVFPSIRHRKQSAYWLIRCTNTAVVSVRQPPDTGRKTVLAAPFVSILSLLLLPDSRLFFCKTGMTARHHCMLHGNTQQACGFYMENGWKAA